MFSTLPAPQPTPWVLDVRCGWFAPQGEKAMSLHSAGGHLGGSKNGSRTMDPSAAGQPLARFEVSSTVVVLMPMLQGALQSMTSCHVCSSPRWVRGCRRSTNDADTSRIIFHFHLSVLLHNARTTAPETVQPELATFPLRQSLRLRRPADPSIAEDLYAPRILEPVSPYPQES